MDGGVSVPETGITNERITAIIRKRIAEIGMFKKAVAEKAGIPYQDFSASLNDRRKIPGSELLALCAVLGLDLSDFKE